MPCRLPTIGRYRRERVAKKNEDTADRHAFVLDLKNRGLQMRADNLEAWCRIAEDVTSKAVDTQEYLDDCYYSRRNMADAMRFDLQAHRARSREETERVLTSDII